MLSTSRASCGHTDVVDRSGTTFPEASYAAKNSPVIYWSVIPRRVRHTVLFGDNPSQIQRLIGKFLRRTKRLLNSFDELEREVRDSVSGFSNSSYQSEVGDCEYTDETMLHSFEQARKARVSVNDRKNL